MNKSLKKLLCACLAIAVLCALVACRTGGDETTAPSVTGSISAETAPAATMPANEGVEDWGEPVDTKPLTTTPVQEPAGAEEDPTDSPDEPTEETTKPTEPTEPTEPREDEDPAVQTSQPQTGTQEPVVLSYEEYMALSPAEQQTYFESFPTLDEFIAWYNAALAEYEAGQDVPVVTGPIDIGDYTNP